MVTNEITIFRFILSGTRAEAEMFLPASERAGPGKVTVSVPKMSSPLQCYCEFPHKTHE